MKLLRILDQYALLPGSHLRDIRELLARNAKCVEHPKVRRSIDLDDVPGWGSFGHSFGFPLRAPGHLLGWRPVHSDYRSASITLKPLANLIRKVESTASVDIRSIEGMLHSKDDLCGHHCLDDWAQEFASWAVQDASIEAADRLLRWRLEDSPSDRLVVHDYDGRIFLANGDGSHRFAAARYIAGKLDRPVLFDAPLERHQVDEGNLRELRESFGVFALRHDAMFLCALYDALQKGRVPYYLGDMPARMGRVVPLLGETGTGFRAIFLPRDSNSANQIISALEDTQAMEVLSELQRQCEAAKQLKQAWAHKPEPNNGLKP